MEWFRIRSEQIWLIEVDWQKFISHNHRLRSIWSLRFLSFFLPPSIFILLFLWFLICNSLCALQVLMNGSQRIQLESRMNKNCTQLFSFLQADENEQLATGSKSWNSYAHINFFIDLQFGFNSSVGGVGCCGVFKSGRNLRGSRDHILSISSVSF